MGHLTTYKRTMAFVLAIVLSALPLLSDLTVSAAELGDNTKKALAADITKDISDTEFSVETCMEGIDYNAEREDIVLKSIEAEGGGEYKPDQTGIYIAKYWVTPKDQSDAYMIERKIILTDTEGEAHVESNGGEEQKDDTDTEDDSETSTESSVETSDIETAEISEQKQPEVEVVSGPDDNAEEPLEELEKNIENGNIMIFSGADNTRAARSSNVVLERGENVYYPDYIGNYLTSWFYVNGKLAYCLEAHKASPPSGDYVAEVLDSNKNLQKVLYYGYGGAGDITGSYLAGKSAEEKYVYTHIAASYAYAGEAGFTGCDYNDLVNAGVIAYIDYLFNMENPPTGELSLSKTSVKATRDGDNQKTPDIKLEGDHRNYITVTVPKNVTCYNKTKGTSATNGGVKVYGGDTFYLSAKMSVTGNYTSGKLHGSVGETWRTLVLTTGVEDQDIGVFESESASPVNFSVEWKEMTRIELLKKDAETQNPLVGAAFGIYMDKECANLLMQMPATDTNGKSVSDYFEASLKKVYVKEITAPPNYVIDNTIHTVNLQAGKTVELTAANNRVKGAVHINKIDRETQSFLPQGDSELAGAVYGLYAKEDIVHPDGKTGVIHKKDSLIVQGTIKQDGTLDFADLYLGSMYVKEISPPEGYLLDTTKYDVVLTSKDQGTAEVTRELTVGEQVKKQAFQLIKISEDGDQTEVELVEGAGFKVYLVSNLSKVKNGELKPSNGMSYSAEDFIGYDFSKEQVAVTYENGKAVPVPELITDKKGYAKSPELPYGLYVVDESTVPENLKKVNPFVVKVDEDNREPMQWRIFDDRPFEFLLKIIKKDAATGNTVLKAGASYKIYDCVKEEYVEQIIQYPKKEKITVFKTNDEGYLVTPEELKSSTYRIEEVLAPDGFVRQGFEMSLYSGDEILPPLSITTEGEYKENKKGAIEITVSSNTAHQIDPDTGAIIVEVEQPNDEQVGSLTLTKKGEHLKEVKGESILDKVVGVVKKVKSVFTGEETETGIFHDFVYEEAGVEGAVFELHAKERIYNPDGAKDENGDPIIRYEKDDLVATLTTDQDGLAVINNLPLGSYYLKETVAGEHFVLNSEMKEFTLTPEDDTQAVIYEGVTYKNERQKIEVTIEKKDSVSGEALEGVIFGLYAAEEIKSNQGDVLLEKDTLIERKATDKEGIVKFDSDLFHGKYYVKEEQRLPGYLPNEVIWEIEANYENQNEDVIIFTKEMENQPTESHFTKVDLTTGEELEGATLQIIDSEKNVVEEWISTKETHIIYGLPEGKYILHEELAPYEDGYVSAADIEFEVKEDGSVAEVEMKDEYSKVEISKTDLTTGAELEGAKLQIINKDGEILEEWVTDGKPHKIEQLPVKEELTLKEISAPNGYEVAESVKFTLEDTTKIQKVEMKDARTPAVPKTGDNPSKPIILLVICGISAAAFGIVTVCRKKKRKMNGKKEV